jgi:hypothetical protein
MLKEKCTGQDKVDRRKMLIGHHSNLPSKLLNTHQYKTGIVRSLEYSVAPTDHHPRSQNNYNTTNHSTSP